MSFKTILVPVEEHHLMNSTLRTALILGRMFDSYVEGFSLRVPISTTFAISEAGAVPIPALEQKLAETEKRSRALFENFMQKNSVQRGGNTKAVSSDWFENAPGGDQFVGTHGRVFDVIVLGKPGRHSTGPRMSTFEAALFETGRPVLIAPPSPTSQMGTNVLIAWNCSTEQARVTSFAMPILRRAKRVTVLTVEGGAAVPGPTGEKLCRSLQLNDVPATPLTISLNGRMTGEAILAHAKSMGCDLLIKGAYTQSRLRQMIFGGTTRYILNNSEVPVLTAH